MITCAAEGNETCSKLRLCMTDNPGKVAEIGEILTAVWEGLMVKLSVGVITYFSQVPHNCHK